MKIKILLDSRLKKVLALIILSISFFAPFSKSRNKIDKLGVEQDINLKSIQNERASDLIKEYMEEYLYDRESYIPLALGPIDSILIIIPVADDEALDLAVNNRDIASDFLQLYRKSSGAKALAFLDSAKVYMDYSKKWLNIAKHDMDKNKTELSGWSVVHTFKVTNAKKITKEHQLKFFLDKDFTRILKIENVDSKKH